MRVVLYARVSTQQQADKQLSISAQLRALRAYAGEKEWDVVREYVDEARSGRNARRPAFTAMLQDLMGGNIDAIFVWKLDRLARNVEISTAVDAHCREYGVRVVSLQEPTDDSPQGKLTARIFESFAEFYSNNLSQDIRRGIRESARQGYYPHGKAPYGYAKETVGKGADPKKRLVRHEVQGPIVVRIFEAYASGQSGSQIARTLSNEGARTNGGRRWRSQRVYDILRNPVYCGDITVGRYELGLDNKVRPGKKPVTIRDAHPPLVSRELFAKANEILQARSASYEQRSWDASPYLLSGLVRCGKCGRHMVGTSAKSGKYHYYTCQQYLREGKASCSGVRVSRKKLESFVLGRVRDVILTPEHLRELVQMVNEELAELRDMAGENLKAGKQAEEKIRARLQRHYSALEEGLLEARDVAPRIRELRVELEAAEQRVAELNVEQKRSVPFTISEKQVIAYVRTLRSTLQRGTFSERKAVISGLVEHITVDDELVEIEYRIPHKEETEDAGSSVLSAVRFTGA